MVYLFIATPFLTSPLSLLSYYEKATTMCVCVQRSNFIASWDDGVYITSWVGQNHICTVYIWYLWLRNHQIYNHIRRIHTVLANPSYKDVQRFLDVVLYGAPIHFSSFHLQRIYAVLLEANSFEMCVSWAQAIIKGSRPSSLHAA